MDVLRLQHVLELGHKTDRPAINWRGTGDRTMWYSDEDKGWETVESRFDFRDMTFYFVYIV
jgi:hypothetical protein